MFGIGMILGGLLCAAGFFSTEAGPPARIILWIIGGGFFLGCLVGMIKYCNTTDFAFTGTSDLENQKLIPSTAPPRETTPPPPPYIAIYPPTVGQSGIMPYDTQPVQYGVAESTH